MQIFKKMSRWQRLQKWASKFLAHPVVRITTILAIVLNFINSAISKPRLILVEGGGADYMEDSGVLSWDGEAYGVIESCFTAFFMVGHPNSARSKWSPMSDTSLNSPKILGQGSCLLLASFHIGTAQPYIVPTPNHKPQTPNPKYDILGHEIEVSNHALTTRSSFLINSIASYPKPETMATRSS